MGSEKQKQKLGLSVTMDLAQPLDRLAGQDNRTRNNLVETILKWAVKTPTILDLIIGRREPMIERATGKFDRALMLRHGYTAADWIAGKGIHTGYTKDWSIQEADGSGYTLSVALEATEGWTVMYLNKCWLGRVMYIQEAEMIVHAIKSGAK